MSDHEYFDKKNIEYTRKLRALLSEMPPYITTYFRGIEQVTAPRTRIAYAGDIKVFLNFLKFSNPTCKNITIKEIPFDLLVSLKSFDIEEYLEYLKLYEDPETGKTITNTETGIKRKLSAIRSLYSYFHTHEMTDKNPTLQVSVPKLHNKNIIRMDAQEVETFLETVENGAVMSQKQREYHDKTAVRDLAIVTLLLGTGIRVSECVGLDLKDVDMKNSKINIVRKGGSESFVYFSDEVKGALYDYMIERQGKHPVSGSENALFLSSRDQRINVRTVEILVKKYARTSAISKKITPHKLRSTYGTALYNETRDIYLVAEVLGHKDVNTTKKHYAALEDERKLSAKDAVKLRKPDEDNK